MRYENGRLPDSVLAPVPGGRMRLDAAAAFNAMNEESERRFGATLRSEGPLGSYRTLTEQEYLYELYVEGRGYLAAVPGTSNHGFGLAIDLETQRMRAIVDEIGAPFGWAKRWSDAPTEWWHLRYRPGIWSGLHPVAAAPDAREPAAQPHASASESPGHATASANESPGHATASAEPPHWHAAPATRRRVDTLVEATAVVQQLLRADGYSAVPVDGIAGAATVSALRTFQLRHGLGPTASLDHETVVALRAVTRHAAPPAPAPSQRGSRPAHGHTHAEPGHTHAKPGHTHAKPRHTHAEPRPAHRPSRQPRVIGPRSPSGFGEEHQRAARQVVATGCELLLKHAGEVRYTLDSPLRWQAIDERLRIADGRFLTWGDCSSTATWLLWNGLTHIDPKMPDIVNGRDWKSGWTGTIAEHGTLVKHDYAIKVGDLILYGSPPSYEHVTVALGGGVCFSHGSNPPMKHPIDYRADRGPVRRFI